MQESGELTLATARKSKRSASQLCRDRPVPLAGYSQRLVKRKGALRAPFLLKTQQNPRPNPHEKFEISCLEFCPTPHARSVTCHTIDWSTSQPRESTTLPAPSAKSRRRDQNAKLTLLPRWITCLPHRVLRNRGTVATHPYQACDHSLRSFCLPRISCCRDAPFHQNALNTMAIPGAYCTPFHILRQLSLSIKTRVGSIAFAKMMNSPRQIPRPRESSQRRLTSNCLGCKALGRPG
jgi:hypothetical protein